METVVLGTINHHKPIVLHSELAVHRGPGPRLLETKAASEEVPKMQDFQRLVQEALGDAQNLNGNR